MTLDESGRVMMMMSHRLAGFSPAHPPSLAAFLVGGGVIRATVSWVTEQAVKVKVDANIQANRSPWMQWTAIGRETRR